MAPGITTVGVVGMGTMGAGIAEVLARTGLDVVAVEVDEQGVARGRGHLEHSTGRALERGKIDEDFVRRYVAMVRMAARQGQYVLVDFHQDEFSSKYAGNGMPAWMADKQRRLAAIRAAKAALGRVSGISCEGSYDEDRRRP